MIILDTNILSGLMRTSPDPVLFAWMNKQSRKSLWMTSISIFELRTGIELLPAGSRREALAQSFLDLVNIGLSNRVFPFDGPAADQAGILSARRRREGKIIEIRDTQIAGIALARRASIATRNVRHFSDLDLKVIDPWSA